MKYLFSAITLIVISWALGFNFVNKVEGCSANSDKLYNRHQILKQFADILNNSIPGYENIFTKYVKDESAENFFVYDLTDTSNKDISSTDCVNFINNHVYHFAATRIPFSISYIAVLEDGKLKIFNAINCPEGKDDFENAIKYLKEKLKNDKNKEEILERVKNYRRYGVYGRVDEFGTRCKESEKIPDNSDKLFDRQRILVEFYQTLFSHIPKDIKYKEFAYFLKEEDERGIGFFTYDLTESSNKQTSLLERVNFKNNHIYHFAFIDLPYSFSNIAILEDGEIKIFRAINCEGKGDSLKEVIDYLEPKLKNDKNKEEILERVKDYRKYGVYTSFNGLSTPQCQELVKPEK